jgi:hypothetical protein
VSLQGAAVNCELEHVTEHLREVVGHHRSAALDDLVEKLNDLARRDGPSIAPVPPRQHIRPKHPARLLRILALCFEPLLDVFVRDKEHARPVARIGSWNSVLWSGGESRFEVGRVGRLLPWCQGIALRRRSSSVVAISLAETIHRSTGIDPLVQPLAILHRELTRLG